MFLHGLDIQNELKSQTLKLAAKYSLHQCCTDCEISERIGIGSILNCSKVALTFVDRTVKLGIRFSS